MNPQTVVELMAKHSHTAGVLPPVPQEEPMPEYTKDNLFVAVGRATRDPEERERNDRSYVNFGLAWNTSYEQGAPVVFFDVSVGNDRLKPVVREAVRKGAVIAVEGYYRKNESGGKVYHNLTATKVGLVSWLVPADKPQQDRVSSEFDF